MDYERYKRLLQRLSWALHRTAIPGTKNQAWRTEVLFRWHAWLQRQ